MNIWNRVWSQFVWINLFEFSKIVYQMDNNTSSEIMDAKFFKNIIERISYCLLQLINNTFDYGKYPDDLETNTIVPIQSSMYRQLLELVVYE